MKKILLAVFVVSVLSSLAGPVQASVGGKNKPPMEQRCSWWHQLVASFKQG